MRGTRIKFSNQQHGQAPDPIVLPLVPKGMDQPEVADTGEKHLYVASGQRWSEDYGVWEKGKSMQWEAWASGFPAFYVLFPNRAETREGNIDEAKCALRQRSKTDIAGRDIRCAVIE